jgi:hypothetical protein
MSHLPLPSNIGKRGTITDIGGTKHVFTVLDEVTQVHATDPDKATYLQKLHLEFDGRVQLRFGYYIKGKRPEANGLWGWGRYATMMTAQDLQALVRKATAKGWFEDSDHNAHG